MKIKLFVFASALLLYSLFIVNFTLADNNGHISMVLAKIGLTDTIDRTPSYLNHTTPDEFIRDSDLVQQSFMLKADPLPRPPKADPLPRPPKADPLPRPPK